MYLLLVYDIFVCIFIYLKCWNSLKEFDKKPHSFKFKSVG